MRLPCLLIVPALLLCACADGAFGGFAPESLHRVQVYDGAPRPPDQVATIFTTDGRPHFESATMCEIDDVSLERDGVCASVAWVLPGEHVVRLRYTSGRLMNATSRRLAVQAGRTYQINYSSLGANSPGLVSIIPMPPGSHVSWRNLAPGLAAGSARIDESVPYVANTTVATARPVVPLTPDERAVADQLFTCSATFGLNAQLLAAGHQDPQPSNDKRAAFLGLARDYVPEASMAAEFGTAQARVRSDYLEPSGAGRPGAHERLAAALDACDTFRRRHADELQARHFLRP